MCNSMFSLAQELYFQMTVIESNLIWVLFSLLFILKLRNFYINFYNYQFLPISLEMAPLSLYKIASACYLI